MNEIVFPESVFDTLRKALLASTLESSAILVATPVGHGTSTRLLVGEVHHVPPSDYRKRNTSRVIVDPVFIAPLAKEAIRGGRSLVFVHTHPGDHDLPSFSAIDDDGEQSLLDFLSKRGSKAVHAALLFGQNACRARLLQNKAPCRVLAIGRQRRVEFEPFEKPRDAKNMDRQIRLLGSRGQKQLESISLAIVGLGGVGSVVAQTLAYLGVTRFTLIDPDTVETTNLNRLVGAGPEDVGRAKVDVAAATVRRANPHASVKIIKGNILEGEVSKVVTESDFFFCCTDSQASRAVLNQLAYQYLIPGINIGVAIAVRGGEITHISGRVQLLAPQIACLTCQDVLDAKTVRLEFMTEAERRQDPYFVGDGEPQPAVISLNSTMASLAVTMFLSVVAGLPSEPRNLIYNAIEGRVRPTAASIVPNCIVCSSRGALSRGDTWLIPGRMKAA